MNKVRIFKMFYNSGNLETEKKEKVVPSLPLVMIIFSDTKLF